MPQLHLTTFIQAPKEVVFDLSRHIGLHRQSMNLFREEAIAGVTNGLINKGESVTWRARHLGKTRMLQTHIPEMVLYDFFIDEQVRGDFKKLYHEHHFKAAQNGTIMIDMLHFESPYGVIGTLFNKIYLTKYMYRLIEQRNAYIKTIAESEKWKSLLR